MLILLASIELVRSLLEYLVQISNQFIIRDYLPVPHHASHVYVQYPIVKVKTMSPGTMDVPTEMYGRCEA